MSNTFHKTLLKTAQEAALSAGNYIIEMRQQHSLEINYKGDVNLVTSVDLGAEEIILDMIQKRFPEHGILSEERAPQLASAADYLSDLWIIDPLDGTTNYAHGHQHVCVSIAFASKGEVLIGVVHCPFLNETFYAIKGGGAFLNDEPIAVASNSTLKKALIATGFQYERDDVDSMTKRVHAVLSHCRDLRRIGSAAIDICWVACGRMDAYYETTQTWDIAAASLIAREAGAKVDHLAQQELNNPLPEQLNAYELVTANPELMPKIMDLLRAV